MDVAAFETLDDMQVEAGKRELARLVGEEEAARASWQRRLARGADGAWLLAVREPTISLEILPPDYPRDRPWSWGAWGDGTATKTRHLPIAEAVTLLTGPKNPEIEVERRARLKAEMVRTTEDEARARAEREAAQRAQDEEHRRRRPERWRALSSEARAAFLAAQEAFDRRDPGTGVLLALARALSNPAPLDRVPAVFEGDAR